MTFGKSALQYLFVLAAVVALLASNEGAVGQTFTLTMTSAVVTMTTNGMTITAIQEASTWTETLGITVTQRTTPTTVEQLPADPTMIIMLLMGLVIVVLAVLLLISIVKLRQRKS